MARVFCAIDTPDLPAAEKLAASLQGVVDIKLGLEFFAAHGAAGVKKVRAAAGAETKLFLDLKFHDIPNTVAGAVRSAVSTCAPDFLTVHASGGREMMRAAVAAAGATKILAVTVLTSLDADELSAVGQGPDAAAQVLRLAQLAAEAGASGIVCSPREIALLRRELPDNVLLVVPGIRPAGSAAGDQKRIMTPQEAAAAGADYLVIGRPITEAADPVAAARGMRG
ncbi:MAG: orotidine-5'-phosphate decarboxylase [Alphaproteobacteria bacterium]|nr:orotidine-5'-phosphate decarboxylase [Alphaproteobacteria bacterium]MDE2337282.1 orotidine-5'-phosphate decarboxylase [Alphaproteobacteria bacterium]